MRSEMPCCLQSASPSCVVCQSSPASFMPSLQTPGQFFMFTRLSAGNTLAAASKNILHACIQARQALQCSAAAATRRARRARTCKSSHGSWLLTCARRRCRRSCTCACTCGPAWSTWMCRALRIRQYKCGCMDGWAAAAACAAAAVAACVRTGKEHVAGARGHGQNSQLRQVGKVLHAANPAWSP